MLYRSISVAVILLLSWFVYDSVRSAHHMRAQLSSINQNVSSQSEALASYQKQTNKQIEEIQLFITSQKQLSQEKNRLSAKLEGQKKLAGFTGSHRKVMQAELLRFNKQYKEAATLLKSTKKEIWQAGDTYKDKQKSLRGLMSKIDALVNAWNKGDAKASAKPIYLTLEKIIQEKGQ